MTTEGSDDITDWMERARAAWRELLATDETDRDAYYDARFRWALIEAEHYDLVPELVRTTPLESEP